MKLDDLAIAKKILGTKGRFFSVEFVKKDGSLRKLNGRMGVKCHLRGGQSTVKDYDKYITAWDCQKKEYRNINIETITKFNGKNVDRLIAE